ncbi:YceI family protein [Aureitalea sp. L0-47]|uniref:YceI family protein n=1 Tax=Aureitalea sp. L0-47 TaxID=2816962 RepID=UPI002237C22E|nr:YceI family protein [Aureitalea sp. L0-47]MCW5518655.1 YceI family protein [Aureitalea sp. L0-47]
MKKLLAILLLIMGSFVHAQENKTLTWQGRAAVGGYAPEGTLEVMEASAQIQGDRLTSLSVVVDMRTLDQENSQLKNHLRDKDFFHVKKFPVATFMLSEAVQLNDSDILLKGIMTIRGKSSEEKIKAEVIKQDDNISISFDHTMDRTVYGITYNSPTVFEKLKENVIADDFILKGTIEAEIKADEN